MNEVFEEAKTDIGPLATKYEILVKDFSAYRATEAAETEGYGKLAAEASRAALDGLDDIEQAILTAALDASAKPGQLTSAAMKLSAQIQQFELASQEAIKPHADFMATHGAALPDMTSAALRSLNAMLGHMQRRVARSDATATGLLLGVSMRRKALEIQLRWRGDLPQNDAPRAAIDGARDNEGRGGGRGAARRCEGEARRGGFEGGCRSA